MRALIQAGASVAGAAGVGGVNPRLNSSMRTRPIGTRGSILRPPTSVGIFQDLVGGLTQGASLPNQSGGMYGAGGGGFDFGSLPDPNGADPAAIQGQGASATAGPPTTGFTPGLPSTPVGTATDGTPLSNNNPNAPDDEVGGPLGTANNGMFHLGGGLYYDPVTDSLRGGDPIRR
jgi:hypothetical protein